MIEAIGTYFVAVTIFAGLLVLYSVQKDRAERARARRREYVRRNWKAEFEEIELPKY